MSAVNSFLRLEYERNTRCFKVAITKKGSKLSIKVSKVPLASGEG
jgi:hypothetical protein